MMGGIYNFIKQIKSNEIDIVEHTCQVIENIEKINKVDNIHHSKYIKDQKSIA